MGLFPNTTDTAKNINKQLDAHGVEFGVKYRDPSSGFEGFAEQIYFFKHGCMRVCLRGMNKTTGEPAEFSFDAPELVRVDNEQKVPAGERTGGPHDIRGVATRRTV